MSLLQTLPETVIAKSNQIDTWFRECPCLDGIQQKMEKVSPMAGRFVITLRQGGIWLFLWATALSLLLLLNLVVWTPAPHFVIDALPWFWAAFGLVTGLAMIFVMKRIIQPFIVRKEDHYGDI